jgi:SagB-type dehydrogenase family enzyme
MKYLENKNNKKVWKFIEYYKVSSMDRTLKIIPVSKWPEDWKKIYFKVYPRFSKVDLNKKFKNRDELIKLLKLRRSNRKFNRYKITLKELSYIMNGAAINKIENNDIYYQSYRSYPSAGARYPLEIYLIVLKAKDLDRGCYHYNVKHNCLEYMWKYKENQVKEIFTGQSFVLKSSLIVVITAAVRRGLSKYKERYFRFVLIEAGHLAQNLLLLATKIGLKCCSIGGFQEKKILELFDIMEDELELPIYAIAIGK